MQLLVCTYSKEACICSYWQQLCDQIIIQQSETGCAPELLRRINKHWSSLISTEKTSHQRNNVDLSPLRKLSSGMQVYTRYRNVILNKGCTSGGLYVPFITDDIPLVDFMYLLLQTTYPWWTLCTFYYRRHTPGGVYVPFIVEDVPLVEFMYLLS